MLLLKILLSVQNTWTALYKAYPQTDVSFDFHKNPTQEIMQSSSKGHLIQLINDSFPLCHDFLPPHFHTFLYGKTWQVPTAVNHLLPDYQVPNFTHIMLSNSPNSPGRSVIVRNMMYEKTETQKTSIPHLTSRRQNQDQNSGPYSTKVNVPKHCMTSSPASTNPF